MLITGSLGSGKTTLLKRILTSVNGRLAVLMVIVHHKGAKDSKPRKESSLKDTTFANLGVLCAFAVHKRLYSERLLLMNEFGEIAIDSQVVQGESALFLTMLLGGLIWRNLLRSERSSFLSTATSFPIEISL